MPYETFIGWRYLFRRGRRKSLLLLLALSLLTALTCGALFLRQTGAVSTTAPSLGPVLGILLGVLGAGIAALLVFFSVFTTVAVIGVMVGVSALIVVLAVTSGFQEEFKEKVLGVNAHV